ncbi:hypothetical protein [Hyunsoonleella pacifica]|uniref:Uncharacterized protein n=1 Tax=Hyunsoonleella pacifica TaxID=1080224 RepID=A0A4V2JB87_9FLAO|nr:hypothetical protein [Hyunsoonleella pacifica]TBN17808.1 hypothetical protein EYD46_05715 [Hyunsoonleella pacifica]GGD08801.1 hypothetical protein GCM10011368_08390 [Hyunsoonleella pacifica]
MIALEFLKSELKSHNLELTAKTDGREGADFFIENYQIYLQPLDLDIVKQSIKITKQDLGELNDNLFIALILIIEQQPRVVYLIPPKQLQDSDNNFFVDNEVSLMPSLSNWEIKISSKTIGELEKYALNNMIDKLKV